MTQKPVFLEGIFTFRNLRSVGAAAILEVLIASGIAAVLVWQELRPDVTPPQPMTDPIIIQDQQLPPVLHPTQAPEQQPQQAPRLSEVPPVQESIPSQTAVPVQLPPVPASNAGRAPGDALAEFEAGMKRAIDSAKVYPQAAVLKAETGTATVSFDYAGGVVSNVRVDKSSGVGRLDEAAMLAVQKAALPPKPAGLAGISHFVILVDFNLG